MFLWLTFALFAAAVATLLLRAPRHGSDRADDPDAAVYRDQLAELEADVARGVVSEAEAASARAEIARRLLKRAAPVATNINGTSAATVAARPSRFSPDTVLMASAAAIPAIGIAVYMAVGSPGLPARPLADRLATAPDKAAPEDLIAKVEQRLRENPGDGMGWQVIAPVYVQRGRFAEAGQAYERAIKLLGETPERLMGLAKALVLANNGMVVEPARAAYARAVKLDANRAEAKFWLAIADEQNGRVKEAEAAFRAMLASAPPEAPWREAVEARLAALTSKSGVDPSNPVAGIPGSAAQQGPLPQGPSKQVQAQNQVKAPQPGPQVLPTQPQMSAPVLAPAAGPKPDGTGPTPAEFVAAAAGMPADMRELMMGRMIARATDAVKAAPKDTAAWSRLVTGYKALGKPAEAADALKQAKAALAGDRAAEAELDALARSLGLPS